MKKYKNILYILPEDEALHSIAVGFIKNDHRLAVNIATLRYVGGWRKVLYELKDDYIPKLMQQCYAQVRILALIDFDGDISRIKVFEEIIPPALRDRIFILGPKNETEDLKKEIKITSPEQTGKALAEECIQNTNVQDGLWQGVQLAHNAEEIKNLKTYMRDFIYKS